MTAGPGAGRRDPAELERAMLEDDDEALVYADWLVEQGDPRGELAHLQHRLEGRPDDPQLREAEQHLMARHRVRLVGPLPAEALRWRRGFIHGANITTLDDLAAVLVHPSARYLRELSLELPHYLATQGVMLLANSSLPSLRSLSLRQDYAGFGDDREVHAAYSLAWGACEHRQADRTWTALPGLRRLAIQGWDVFHSLQLPELVELTILEGAPFCAWGEGWDCPALERIRWRWLCDATGTSVMFDSCYLDPLRKAALPALRELDLSECLVGPGGARDDVPEAEGEPHWLLDDLPFIDELEVLRLATYHLGTGARLVASLANRSWLLAHLRELGVRGMEHDAGARADLAAKIRHELPSFRWLDAK